MDGNRKRNGYKPTRLALPPGEPKEKQQRSKRPGQSAAQVTVGRKRTYIRGEGSGGAGGEQRSDAGKHEADMKKRLAVFDETRAENVRESWAHTPALVQMRQKRREQLVGLTQGSVDEAAEALAQAPCGSCGKKVQTVRVRDVEVVDFEYRSVLKVPVFGCTDEACLCVPFSVPPIAAYCAPTSATIECRKWVTVPLLLHFSELHFGGGVSGHGGSFFPVFAFSDLVFDHLLFFFCTLCSLWPSGGRPGPVHDAAWQRAGAWRQPFRPPHLGAGDHRDA